MSEIPSSVRNKDLKPFEKIEEICFTKQFRCNKMLTIWSDWRQTATTITFRHINRKTKSSIETNYNENCEYCFVRKNISMCAFKQSQPNDERTKDGKSISRDRTRDTFERWNKIYRILARIKNEYCEFLKFNFFEKKGEKTFCLLCLFAVCLVCIRSFSFLCHV